MIYDFKLVSYVSMITMFWVFLQGFWILYLLHNNIIGSIIYVQKCPAWYSRLIQQFILQSRLDLHIITNKNNVKILNKFVLGERKRTLVYLGHDVQNSRTALIESTSLLVWTKFLYLQLSLVSILECYNTY